MQGAQIQLQKLDRCKQLAFEDFNWKIKCLILQRLMSTDEFYIMFAPMSVSWSRALSPMHWVSQKVHLSFSIKYYRETQMNILANQYLHIYLFTNI